MHETNSRTGRRERGTASLSLVLVLFALTLALSLASLSLTDAGVRHAAQARESATAYFIALAGLNEGIVEVRQGVDGSGDRAAGLGALGIAAPLPYLNSDGNKLGEYRTYVVDKASGGDPSYQVIRVLAAVPSFATPSVVHAMEAHLGTKEVFLLTPNVGAVAVSGPVSAMVFTGWDSPELQIDGGTVPGLIFSEEGAHQGAVDLLSNEHASGGIDGSEILGSPVVTHSSAAGEFGVSMYLDPASSFTGQQLTDYRDALREYAEGLVHATPVGNSVTVDYAAAAADGVVVVHELAHVKDAAGSGKPRITSDNAFGTPALPETVFIDSSRFYKGGNSMTDDHGRTITGAGTLVVVHAIGSSNDTANGKQFNLDWTGDVFVVGYPADHSTGVGENAASDNMLFLSRTDWNIDGNLIIATAGSTEASLELRGLGSDPARLTVNGSVLVFGEASTKEAEIDLEGSAYFEVNGIVGVYGARVEIESQSATSTDFIVNGTMVLGLPDTTTSELCWDVRGNSRISYDQQKVDNAIAGLTALQASMTGSSASVTKIVVSSSNTLTQGCNYSSFAEDLEALEAEGGRAGSGNYGADLGALGVN